MAFDSARNVTVLFGGFTGQDTGSSRETWEWDGVAWTLRSNIGPTSRNGHAMAFDDARGVTVMFGGHQYGGLFNNETWEWDGSVWTLRAIGGPPPQSPVALAYDSVRNVCVLVSQDSGETWVWDGTRWTLLAIGVPSPRAAVGLAYDSHRGTTVLFGGVGAGGAISETWEWDGLNWSYRDRPGPIGRHSHCMAFDPDRGVTVLLGGDGVGSLLDDMWEWNGTDWAQRAIATPSPRNAFGMVYDSRRRAMVLFGGATPSGYNGETWELVSPCSTPTIATQPVDQNIGVDAPATFFVEAQNAAGCSAELTYQWQRRNPLIVNPDAPGAWIDLTPAAGFVNPRTSALLIPRPTPALATGYRCRIGGGCGCFAPQDTYIYTNVVNFSVACPADFNADGGIDGADIDAFFARWESGC